MQIFINSCFIHTRLDWSNSMLTNAVLLAIQTIHRWKTFCCDLTWSYSYPTWRVYNSLKIFYHKTHSIILFALNNNNKNCVSILCIHYAVPHFQFLFLAKGENKLKLNRSIQWNFYLMITLSKAIPANIQKIKSSRF